MLHKIILLNLVGWVLFPLNGACQEQTPFRIGVIQSLSGVAEEDGQTITRSLRLAAQEINTKSPDQIELIVEDDGTLPKNAISAFRKLKEQKVDAIIGATWQHTTAALTPLAAETSTVLFNSSNFPEVMNFDKGGGYVFTNAYSIADDLDTFKRFVSLRKLHSVIFLRNVSNWSLVQVERYKRFCADNRIEVLDDIQSDQLEKNDWRNLLPRIKAAKPDAIAFFLSKSDTEAMLRRARELKMTNQFFGASHTYDAWKNSHERSPYEDICFTYPLEQIQKNADFTSKYTNQYHEAPQLYADSSYDALFILHKALQLSRKNHTNLKQELESAEFVESFGTYHYSPATSLSRGKTSLVCVKDGKLEVLAK